MFMFRSIWWQFSEKEQAAHLKWKENTNTLTEKNENDKASAEESRLKALERLGQTKKRNADSCDEVIKPKSRRSTTEAVQILKEKFENEKEFRKEEEAEPATVPRCNEDDG